MPTMASAFLFNPNGGSIAYFGETVVEPDQSGTDLEGLMFAQYTVGNRVLGDIWRNAEGLYWLINRKTTDTFGDALLAWSSA